MIKNVLRQGVILLILSLILLTEPVAGQVFPSIEIPTGTTTAPQSIPTFRQGNIEVSPVFLDGKGIALISADIGINRDKDTKVKLSAQDRSYIVHGKLQRYLQSMNRYSVQLRKDGITDIAEQRIRLKNQIRVYVDKEKSGNTLMLAFPRRDPAEVIVSTTAADVARIREESSDPERIAQRTAARARDVLLDAWEERQRPYLISAFQRSLTTLVIITALSTLVRTYHKWVKGRIDAVNKTHDKGSLANRNAEDDGVGDAVTSRKSRRLRMYRKARGSLLLLWASLLYWSQWLLWMVGIAWVAGEFFITRPAGNFILGVSIRELDRSLTAREARFAPLDWLMSLGTEATIGPPLLILIICIAMVVAIRIGNAVCDYYVVKWMHTQHTERMAFRAPTLASALKAWYGATVYLFVGIIIFYHLHRLGALTQAVAIILGFLSFALSLASQNLIRDLINGLLILIEDQLAVGDVVVIGEHAGLVERMTLRTTQLRNLDGELISIPNGVIGVIKNLTSSWSRVNYTIQVALSEDVDRAMKVVSNVADELVADPDWSGRILDAPELLGVDEIAHQGVLIRILIKTKPFEQWPVGREFRRRLKLALDDAGISVGAPRLELMQVSSMKHAEQ